MDYYFTYPETGEPERKHTWVVRHDGLFFASGWYRLPDDVPADETPADPGPAPDTATGQEHAASASAVGRPDPATAPRSPSLRYLRFGDDPDDTVAGVSLRRTLRVVATVPDGAVSGRRSRE